MVNHLLIANIQVLPLLISLNFFQLSHSMIKELKKLHLLVILAIMTTKIQLSSLHKYLIPIIQKNSKML